VDRRSRLVVALAALVVLLTGALMFLLGRMSASDGATSQANSAEATAPAAPAAGPTADSSTGARTPLPPPRPAPSPSAEEPGTIPTAFQGEWNRQLDHCGTGLNDSALSIEPGAMRFYESRGEVTRVTRTGERELSVEADFRGEGETWRETVRLTLSADGEQLTVGSDEPRRRCR
jgi:hypothetical protein